VKSPLHSHNNEIVASQWHLHWFKFNEWNLR